MLGQVVQVQRSGQQAERNQPRAKVSREQLLVLDAQAWTSRRCCRACPRRQLAG